MAPEATDTAPILLILPRKRLLEKQSNSKISGTFYSLYVHLLYTRQIIDSLAVICVSFQLEDQKAIIYRGLYCVKMTEFDCSKTEEIVLTQKLEIVQIVRAWEVL
jgi:hypothetical protein